MTPRMREAGSASLPSRKPSRKPGRRSAIPEPRAGNPHPARGTAPPRRRPLVPKAQARAAHGRLPLIAKLPVLMNGRRSRFTSPSSKVRPAATEAEDPVGIVADRVAEAGADITHRPEGAGITHHPEAAGITQRQEAAGEDTVLPRTLRDPGSRAVAVGRRQTAEGRRQVSVRQ